MWRRKKKGKKEKKKKCGTCVEDKKKGKRGKKKERKENGIKIFSQQILSGRLLLANIGEKKIIFLEREKNNFNSMFKLKSVSIFISIFSQYFHNKS